VKEPSSTDHVNYIASFGIQYSRKSFWTRENAILTKLNKILAVSAILACLVATAGAQQDFTLTTAGGQTVPISSMRGKVLVLLFSGVQDPQRREALKALASLAERYQGKDVKVCWVSVNSSSELTDEQLKSAGATAPSVMVLRDTNQAAFKRFSGKLAQLPTVVVLDRQGNPVGQPRGGFNPNSDFINDMSSTIDGVLRH
jgi:peroxiredoxin